MSKCRKCGRALKNPVHVAAGIGPVCAKKERASIEKMASDSEDAIEPYRSGDDIYIERKFAPTDVGPGNQIEMQQHTCSGIRTNVQRTITRHSPTGFNFGYGGSGPADLALNILAMFCPNQEQIDRNYQDFKFKFCAGGGDDNRLVIPRQRIIDFMAERNMTAL